MKTTKVNQFRLTDYHYRNFGGNISVVKVKGNHYAVLILDTDDFVQHVYIYKATEEIDKYGNYSYSWDYSSPVITSFNEINYIPKYSGDFDEKALDDFYKKKKEWNEGKHIHDWIIKNMK